MGPGTVLGAGHKQNGSLGAESTGRPGNPTRCSFSALIDKDTGHLGTQVYSGQEGREGKKERCQRHLGPEVSLTCWEDHLPGQGLMGISGGRNGITKP